MLIEGATVDLRLENQRLRAELHAQTQELRGSRGLYPAILTQRGLEPALESLANVVKHAGAGLVAVDVRVERGRLVIDVTDDGCGGASAHGGSGLDGLADRVGALEGCVEIDSPPGAGTRLRVEIPLSRPAASPPLRSRPVMASPCRRFLRGG